MMELSDEKSLSKVDQVLDLMQQVFKRPFFKNSDVRAACAVGALTSYAAYIQESNFKTYALSKTVSASYDHMNRDRLQRLFSQASELIFKALSKRGVRVSTKHRALAAEMMANTEWTSSPQDLQLAFVVGYDLFSKMRGESNEQEE